MAMSTSAALHRFFTSTTPYINPEFKSGPCNPGVITRYHYESQFYSRVTFALAIQSFVALSFANFILQVLQWPQRSEC